MSNETKILPPEELPPAMRDAFKKIYAKHRAIAALKAKHITPIAEEIKEIWTDLKAESDIARKDLDLIYKFIARYWEAEDMDDEAEGKAILADLRKAFHAAKDGEMINFLDFLADAPTESTDEFEKNVAKTVANLDTTVVSITTSKRNAKQKRDEVIPQPAAEWTGDQKSANAPPPGIPDAGWFWNAGKDAGFNGAGPESNPYLHGDEVTADIWEKGRIKGATLKASGDEDSAAENDMPSSPSFEPIDLPGSVVTLSE